MLDGRSIAGLLLIGLLALPVGSAVTSPAGGAPVDATRAFVSDDADPDAGALPPFVHPRIRDVIRAENASLAAISRMRDFSYATTQPSYRVGPAQQTLAEYRLAQLRSVHRNDSTSLWLPDSQRSNGTAVTDAHITLLGTQEGTRTRLDPADTNSSGTERDLLLIPRNGTVLTYLDYATRLPNRTCTVTGDTRTCLSYSLLEQDVERSVRIGDQTWTGDAGSSRQLTYTGATATEPTTMQVRATITSRVAVETAIYTRDGGGWQLANTTTSDTLELSHTVQDRARVVVTTNQNLTATQTIVRSEDGITRVVLQFEGPRTLSDRRLWSYAQFRGSAGRVQNVWGVYSQRRHTTATRGQRLLSDSTPTDSLPDSPSARPERTLARLLDDAQARQTTTNFPNVLELQLIARSRQPTVRWTESTSVTAAPEITHVDGAPLADHAAPLDRRVNLTSVPPRTSSTVVVTNVDRPITEVRDIHNDSIPLTTRTVRERNASLSTTTLNDTHARVRLTDAATGEPLAGRLLWLTGAAHGQVTTDSEGTVVIERRDLYVTVSFPGATDAARQSYHGPAQTRVAFQSEPFNIYQLLTSLAGALVSVAAFLVFFAPVAYMRRGSS